MDESTNWENPQSDQSYPVYGKPQSDWQPGQETEPLPDPYAPSTQPQPVVGGVYEDSGAQAQSGAYQPAGGYRSGTTGQMPSATPTYIEPAEAGKKGSKGGLKTFAVSFAGAAVACILAFGIGSATGVIGGKTSTTLGSTASSSVVATDDDATLAEAVAAKALPSVVSIDVYTQTTTGYYGYSSGSSELEESSLGSGVVLSSDGYIITNYHVIEGASALKVTIQGVEYDADIIGSDASSDIAVIKAKDASGLVAIEIGDSDNLTIGEWVMSIGSPFGLEQSVATGIVSATSRSQIYSDSSSSGSSIYDYYYGNSGSTSYTMYVNMIQTDAAINPGNSGGALVDKDGKLIGINTLITSYSGNYSGVGFAIPVNYAVSIAQQLINGETPSHAQLGVTLSSVTSSNASRYGLAVSSGAYVSSVSVGSAAADAGIQQGDIITKFGDSKIESATDLMLAVREHAVGDTVSVELNRNGSTQTVSVTLGSDASSTTSSSSSSQQNSNSSNGSGSGSSIYDYLFGGGSSMYGGSSSNGGATS